MSLSQILTSLELAGLSAESRTKLGEALIEAHVQGAYAEVSRALTELELIKVRDEAESMLRRGQLGNELCKSVAMFAGTTPKVIRQYVAALSANTTKTRDEAERLVMLFNALPTVAGLSPDDRTTVTVLPGKQVAA